MCAYYRIKLFIDAKAPYNCASGHYWKWCTQFKYLTLNELHFSNKTIQSLSHFHKVCKT